VTHGKLSCFPCASMWHTAKRSIRRVPNGGTRQNMTASTGRDRRATWRYVCRVPPCGTRQRARFTVWLTEAHSKIWQHWPAVNVGPCDAIFVVCRSVAHGKEIGLPCAKIRAHGEASFRHVLCFDRVFCIWPTAKALFAVCPMICARRTLRHTVNYRFPVVSVHA